MKKKILMIATGGTIASRAAGDGLSPQIGAKELLGYVPDAAQFCDVDTVQPFNLDSTNISPKEWLKLAKLIESQYEYYDGFVICHGTDTMAYTAAALSYLIQNNLRPVVITGAQKPIDLPDTDARTNLLDSLRFAADDRAHGVCIVFGGRAIAGTRARKERTRSYNAFSSINYPDIAIIQDKRIIFYIDDKLQMSRRLQFYHTLDERVFLFKLVPGAGGHVLDVLREDYDAVIIESFGVGGLPQYSEPSASAGTDNSDGSDGQQRSASTGTDSSDGQQRSASTGTDSSDGSDGQQRSASTGTDSFREAIRRFMNEGKMVIMATQVTHEGSDMSIYQVGQDIKQEFNLPESYDMTLEAVVAKTMWILGQTTDPDEFRRLFYTEINHDMLFMPEENAI